GGSLVEEVGETLALLLQLVGGQDGLRGFSADDESAADGSGCVAYWTVAIRPVDVFEFSVAIDGDELILVPGGFARAHDRLDLGTDYEPDFGPAVAALLAE